MNIEEIKGSLEREGLTVIHNFFQPEQIEKLRRSAESVFEQQSTYRNFNGSFLEKMIRLFNEDRPVFINCGKIIQQGLLELYKLAFCDELTDLVKSLGIINPLVCTRPVLFFNHPELAEKELYYKTPLHQDWPSMQASLNSLVIWVPLVDITEENGGVIFYPGSHKNGALFFERKGGFAGVDKPDTAGVQPKLNIGDIVVFSTFLVHKSGQIKDNSIRWSCHFRYTDLNETDFIKRGFPSPYTYQPTFESS